MTLYARSINNVAVELFTPPTDTSITDCFHSDVAAQFVTVPVGTQLGATFAGGVWTNPPAPSQEPTVYPKLTPIQYYNSFTIAEAIAIQTSTDPVVKEIYNRLQMVINNAATANNPIIDPNSTPVVAGLTYLSTTNTIPASNPVGPYIAPARVAQIQAGIAQ